MVKPTAAKPNAAPAAKKVPPDALTKLRPVEKATITVVAKTDPEVEKALKLHRDLIAQIDKHIEWAKEPEENGKLYLAHWALALETRYRPKWDDAVNLGSANKFIRDRRNEDTHKRGEVEEAAAKVVEWLEHKENAGRLRKLGAEGASKYAEIIEGLGETRTGSAHLRKQYRERATSLFGKLASQKPESEWLEKELDIPERVKKGFEVSFLEVLGEFTASIFEEAEVAAEHQQHGHAGLIVIKDLITKRFGIEVSVQEEHLHVAWYVGPDGKAKEWKGSKLVFSGKVAAAAGKVAGHLVRYLAWANLAAKLYAFRGNPDKLVAALNSASAGAGVLQSISDCKALVDKLQDKALPRVRSLRCVEELAKHAAGKNFVRGLATELGKGAGLGAFIGLCDMATGTRTGLAKAADHRYGEAAAQGAIAASGLVSFIGFCMLPFPGLDLIGAALVFCGTIGGVLSTVGMVATEEDPMHAWVRHSSFGTNPSNDPEEKKIEKQIERLHEKLYAVNVLSARAEGERIALRLEVTNITLASKIDARIAGDAVGAGGGWHDLFQGPLAQNAHGCKVTLEGGDGIKEIELHIPGVAGKRLGQVRVELTIDVHGEGSTVAHPSKVAPVTDPQLYEPAVEPHSRRGAS